MILCINKLELLTSPISSDYQPITEKEAIDLKQMMENCKYAVSNAELFMENLSKDLSILDGVKSNLDKLINFSKKVLLQFRIIYIFIHFGNKVIKKCIQNISFPNVIILYFVCNY